MMQIKTSWALVLELLLIATVRNIPSPTNTFLIFRR